MGSQIDVAGGGHCLPNGVCTDFCEPCGLLWDRFTDGNSGAIVVARFNHASESRSADGESNFWRIDQADDSFPDQMMESFDEWLSPSTVARRLGRRLFRCTFSSIVQSCWILLRTSIGLTAPVQIWLTRTFENWRWQRPSGFWEMGSRIEPAGSLSCSVTIRLRFLNRHTERKVRRGQ